MKELVKVNYITKDFITECYIIKKLNGGYLLMTTEIYHSRVWGNPPYWEIPSELDKQNYHLYASDESVKFYKNIQCLELQLGILTDYYENRLKDIDHEIKELIDEKECLLEERMERTKLIEFAMDEHLFKNKEMI